MTTVWFPQVTGKNLEGRQYTLPRDLAGALNIVLLPFERWQQDEVDSWAAALHRLTAAYPGLRYYEVPLLDRFNPVARRFIDDGMRSGIPDRATRERTITLYADKQAIRSALRIPNEEHVRVFLVAPMGAVHWHGVGPWRQESEDSLRVAIAEAAAMQTPGVI